MNAKSLLVKLTAIICSVSLLSGSIVFADTLAEPEPDINAAEQTDLSAQGIMPRYIDPDVYEPNDSYTQAPDLTPDDVAVTNVSLSATFHQMNDVDWYKITFYYDYDASFYIGQVNQGDNITVYKEDAATQIASKSVPSGATSAVISASLSPGVYYIKVVGDPQENDTDGYFMEIDFNRYPINEPNGKDAYLNGTVINVSESPNIEDKVTNSDKYKLYKIDVPSTGYLEFDYEIDYDSNNKWKYGITLYKLDDNLKVVEQREADLSDYFRLDVTAGEKYSIKVWSEVGTLIPDTTFMLMFFYAEGDRYEHNNTREQAYDISSAINGVSSYQLDATIHNAGVNRNDVDYYKLIPNENCTLTVTCSGYGMNFILLDGNEAEDGKTAVTTETKELVRGNTYYIKLYCKTSSFNAQPYSLTFTKTTAPTPTPTTTPTPTPTPRPSNDSLENAIDITDAVFRTPAPYDMEFYRSSIDTWYKIYGGENSDTSRACFKVGLKDNTPYELYNADGTIITDYQYYEDGIILEPLKTYYIKIIGYGNGETDTYIHYFTGWHCDISEPNSTQGQAYDLGEIIQRTSTEYDYHTDGDTVGQGIDYYKILPTVDGTIYVILTPEYFDPYDKHDRTVFKVFDESGNSVVRTGSIEDIYFNVTQNEPVYICVQGHQDYNLYIAYDNPGPTPTPDPDDNNAQIIINNTFEDGDKSAWTDVQNRSTSTIEREENTQNHYLKFTPTSDLYYDYRCLKQDISGNIQFQMDVKFTEKDMEIQMRDVVNNGAAGHTIPARIKKYAYYIEYYSDGKSQKLLTPTGSWLQLKDVSKWYTIKICMDTNTKKQSVYLSERDTGKVIGVVEDVPLMKNVDKINWIAVSSSNTLCIDNAKLTVKHTEDPEEPNDSIETATDLGTTSLNGAPGGGAVISFPGDKDYYKVTVGKDCRTLHFYVANYQTGADMTLEVYDSSGNVHTQHSDGKDMLQIYLNGENEGQALYYCVYGAEGEYYTEVVSYADPDEPNDTKEQAVNLGTTSLTGTLGGIAAIDYSEDKDYYQVKSGSNGNLIFFLEDRDYHTSKNLILEVYDLKGNVYTKHTKGEKTISMSFGVSVNDIFYVCVYGDVGSYYLEAFVQNNTIEDALYMGTVGIGCESADILHVPKAKSDKLYCEVQVRDDGKLTFLLSDYDINDDIVFEIYTEEKELIYLSHAFGESEITTKVPVKAGQKYYLCVYGTDKIFSSDVRYTAS